MSKDGDLDDILRPPDVHVPPMPNSKSLYMRFDKFGLSDLKIDDKFGEEKDDMKEDDEEKDPRHQVELDAAGGGHIARQGSKRVYLVHKDSMKSTSAPGLVSQNSDLKKGELKKDRFKSKE